MRYATLNLLLGIAICYQGVLFPAAFIPLLWFGFSFMVLGLAYWLRRVALLGKRPDGSIAWWSWLALLPLHLLIHVVWHLARLCTRERSIDFISEQFAVGRRLSPTELPPAVELVVDLTAEFPEPTGVRQGRDYRLFPILDASVPDIRALREFIASLPDVITYVHCAQGHGRTGLFSIAYLVQRGVCATAAEALAVLTAARPGIVLNREQRAFVTTHFGQASE